MKKEQSIKKNFLYQAFYEILVLALPLLTSPYVSRVLGAANIGIYSYTYTIANYFVLFCLQPWESKIMAIERYPAIKIVKKH